MAFRYLTPALAVAGLAAAQCSVQGTTTISTAAQATGFSNCQTFQGSIAIARDTSDEISLSGIQRIKGSLVAESANHLSSLEADSLSVIDDFFTLTNCSALTNLNFPSLVNVNHIKWIGLANLQGLSFTQGVQMANTVLIENTGLTSLEGIDLEMVDAMALTNNGDLSEANMQLSNISTILIVQGNGEKFSLSLPNLISANSLNLQNVSSIDLASLSSVNGTLGFYSNFVESFSCPNLTQIGQTLAIDANAELTMVDFPELVKITGGMQIQNNTEFKNASGFPKLQTVGGAVAMYGVFDTVPLPSLKTVSGAFTILSSSGSKTLSNQCTHYNSIHGRTDVIRGSMLECNPNVGHASTKGHGGASPSGSPSQLASGSPSASTSPSAAGSLIIPGATGLLGVVAAMFGML